MTKSAYNAITAPPNADHWIRFDDFRILELPE